MTTNTCTVPAVPAVPAALPAARAVPAVRAVPNVPAVRAALPAARAAALPGRARTQSAGLAAARAAVRAWGWLLDEARRAADVDARLRARRDEDAAHLARGSGLLGRLY